MNTIQVSRDTRKLVAHSISILLVLFSFLSCSLVLNIPLHSSLTVFFPDFLLFSLFIQQSIAYFFALHPTVPRRRYSGQQGPLCNQSR